MNMRKTIVMAAAVASLAAGGALAGTNSSDVLEIADDGMKWRFVPVEGTSQLPLEFMRTGKNRDKREPVTIDRFWIAEKMVTEGEFAAVMGRKVREGRKAGQFLSDVEWIEGVHFCRRFNEKYRRLLPNGFVLSMPTMLDWAHATEVLKGKVDLCAEAGAMIFASSVSGGFLYAPRTSGGNLVPGIDLVWLPRHGTGRWIGLRPVLIPVAGKVLDEKRMVTSSGILLDTSFYEEASGVLKLALSDGGLDAEDEAWAREALEHASEEHEEHYIEDWNGLILAAASFAEKKGFRARPFTDGWGGPQSVDGGGEYASIAAEYKKAGIVGEWMRIGDLPPDVRKGQSRLGDKNSILLHGDIDGVLYSYEYTITESNLVQVLRCDFTGDGRNDMVVENYGNTDSDGYWYSFYEATGDGGYREVDGIRVVGLCVLPRKTGRGGGFLILGTAGDPDLTASLYVFKGGKLAREDVSSKPFYMLDAKVDRIYMMAPFIGGEFGRGWRMLESRGIWFRPVYWPWKQGEVQGYKEAVKMLESRSFWLRPVYWPWKRW